MMKKIISTTALALLLSFNAYAAEPDIPEEEVLSSEIIGQRQAIEQKNKAVKDINNQIRRRSDVELREYIRNSNEMNKIINPKAKAVKVDYKNKNAVSKFIQDDIELSEKIITTSTPDKTTVKTKYKSRAGQDLK